jgi:hypothetical protein
MHYHYSYSIQLSVMAVSPLYTHSSQFPTPTLLYMIYSNVECVYKGLTAIIES